MTARQILLYLAAAVLLALLGSVIYRTRPTARPAAPGVPLTIATTIFPLADIARQVGGEYARVLQLLPAGADPHGYAATPRQVAELETARTLFLIDHSLDDWAIQLARSVNLPVIVVDQNITLRPFGDEDGSPDPHYWLTVPNARQITRTVAAELQRLDPARADAFAANAAAYEQRLAALEEELQQQAAASPQKKFIAMHDAWSYFADHYGFTLVATYEPVEGRTPSLADLQQLRRLVTEHQLTVFYAEPAKSSSAAVRFMKQELGLTVGTLDDIGGRPPRDSYIALMRENMRALSPP